MSPSFYEGAVAGACAIFLTKYLIYHMKKPATPPPIFEKVYMVEGGRITVLPVIRRTPKGVVYLKHGDVEVNARPSFYVQLFPTEAAAREFVRTMQDAEVSSLERQLERARKRHVHLDISLVEEAEAEAKDPGQARRRRMADVTKKIPL